MREKHIKDIEKKWLSVIIIKNPAELSWEHMYLFTLRLFQLLLS